MARLAGGKPDQRCSEGADSGANRVPCGRLRPSYPSCSETRRHCHARAAFLRRVCILCVQTLLGSTMRPSCMHHKKGSCSGILYCIDLNVAPTAPNGPFTAVHGRAPSRCSFCATYFAMVACGIQPFHSECVSAQGSRSLGPAAPHEHHRDTLAMQSLRKPRSHLGAGCRGVSLSPVTETSCVPPPPVPSSPAAAQWD